VICDPHTLRKPGVPSPRHGGVRFVRFPAFPLRLVSNKLTPLPQGKEPRDPYRTRDECDTIPRKVGGQLQGAFFKLQPLVLRKQQHLLQDMELFTYRNPQVPYEATVPIRAIPYTRKVTGVCSISHRKGANT